jgi:hypothetical protein
MKPLNAEVQILHGQEALKTMEQDMAKDGDMYGWQYLLMLPFAQSFLAEKLTRNKINLILDHKMRNVAAEMQRWNANFRAWTWSYNRTMHDKTLIIPAEGLTYVATYNLTKGSWYLSSNRLTRIRNDQMSRILMGDWEKDRSVATKVQTAHKEKEKQK